MESLTGFLRVPPPLTAFPHISPANLFLLFRTRYFFIRTLKNIEKEIREPPPDKRSRITAPEFWLANH